MAKPGNRVATSGWLLICLAWLGACVQAATTLPTPPAPDLDTLIQRAERVVFVIPFSHWDTDWHNDFTHYAAAADRNIHAAIALAKQDARFRYTLEQPLFVQHFWEENPQARNDLKRLVQNRQFTFAWAGVTQPETSLVGPAIQVRNWQLGRQWITETFGPEFVPHTAWQSDAFGNSAALPLFLQQIGVPYLFIGRWQGGCNPERSNCTPFPQSFYWKTPASDARVLVTYMGYSDAWGKLYRLKTEAEQLAALRQVVDRELKRTDSKFLLLPIGFDFYDPFPYLLRLIDRWNASTPHVALTMADPETAFGYLATQELPELEVDLNPLWQAFYGSRPVAKIADKESEYLLTAVDKFALLAPTPQSSAWYTAAISAHYDNISGVGYDWVWTASQRPRYQQTVTTAANDLAATLAQVASGVDAPITLFNPTSWSRSEVVELHGDLPDQALLPAPVQPIDRATVAIWAGSVPPVGYTTQFTPEQKLAYPVQVDQIDGQITLRNGLTSITLDATRGATFTSLQLVNGPELLAGLGDDLVYFADTGDVYGARFGDEVARASQTTAQVTVLAAGPLLARVQARLTLGGQSVTKTVTLRANDPQVEVALTLKALPATSAILQIPTSLRTETRTDDLGFSAFTHTLDNRPITPGDITYRRQIFYPIMYWSDVTDGANGLALLTHGLQGLGGASALNLLLVRWAEDEGSEGLTDPDYHTLRYAYLPHSGATQAAQPWLAAYAFNQPLIPIWRKGEQIHVQLPFVGNQVLQNAAPPRSAPRSASLFSVESGLLADIYREDNQLQAVVIDYDPATPAVLHRRDGSMLTLPQTGLGITGWKN